MVHAMPDSSDEYFRLWISHEIDLAHRQFVASWKAIDAKAAATGWYKSGRRIKECVRSIADTVGQLADKVFRKASEMEDALECHLLAGRSLSEFLTQLTARTPALIQSTTSPTQRTENAVGELIAQIKADLQTATELARFSIIKEKRGVLKTAKQKNDAPKTNANGDLEAKSNNYDTKISQFDSGWIRLGEALEKCENASDHDSKHLQLHSEAWARQIEFQTNLHESLSEAGARGELVFKGVKVIARESAFNGPLEEVPSEYFRVARTFFPQGHEIHSWSDSESTTEFALAQELGERHPKWIDVIVEKARFEFWLRLWLKDWFISEVGYGRMTPQEAEALAADAGLAPLAATPESAQFDPMQQPYWTFAMVIAWLVWGTPEAVQEHWSKYRDGCLVWKLFKVPSHSGHVLEQRPSPTALGFTLNWAHDNVENKGNLRMTLNDARQMLKRALEIGKVTATAFPEAGTKRALILKSEWQDLELVEARNQEALQISNGKLSGIIVYRIPTISSAEVLSELKTLGTGPEIARSVIADEKNCQKWLEKQMEANLLVKTMTKATVKAKWRENHSIADRAFERAWSSAISATGATAWTKAGAPKNSKR